MTTNEIPRWVVSLIAIAAIVALIAFARGSEQRGEPVPTPAAAIVVTV
jgi:hypothetical protein